MFHVVQANLANEREFNRMLDALVDAGVKTYAIVKVVPFVHETMPEINPTGDVMVWGCHGMCQTAIKKNWKPGVFLNENFDMRVLFEKYGDNMLNLGGEFMTFGTIPVFEGKKFIRPVYDDKAFTGEVIDGAEFQNWREKVLAYECENLTADTPVLMAPVQQLDCEARFFVVDGKIITGSTYRVFGNQVRNRIDSTNAFGMPMWQFAQKMVDLWQPARAFVIDIALVGGECKVIEINCINASGQYDCDMSLVVRAIEMGLGSLAQ